MFLKSNIFLVPIESHKSVSDWLLTSVILLDMIVFIMYLYIYNDVLQKKKSISFVSNLLHEVLIFNHPKMLPYGINLHNLFFLIVHANK